MPAGARIVNVTSDAAVEAYEGWGGYGSSKAALEQLTRVLAVERPQLAVYAFDPGDMNTRDAPGGLPGRGHLRSPAARGQRARAAVALLEGDLPSGRYRDADVRVGDVSRAARLRAARAPRGPRAARGARAGARRRAHARRARRRPPRPCAGARPARLPALRRPRGHQHVGDAARRAARAAHRRHAARAAPLDPAARAPARTAGSSSCAPAPSPSAAGAPGDVLHLPGGGRATLETPYLTGARLWGARLELPEPLLAYLARHGAPIRYRYVPDAHPLSAYETAYATEPGSAEMPSAGRPVTPAVLTALAARASRWRPIVLHTGVSSPERGERPYPERYRVPAATARLVHGHAALGRARHRRRHDRGARAGDRRARRRHGRGGGGLDRARGHPGARRARRRRPADRLARARGLAPGHARGDRGPRAASSAPTPPRCRRGTCGTSSATCTSSLP